METTAKKKSGSRPEVVYVLTADGGPIAGKSVNADSKSAARAVYDAWIGICDGVAIQKVIKRVCTREELVAIKRPKRAAGVTSPKIVKK